MNNQATELAIGDRVELHFGPFAASWEVVELIDAGARFAYQGDVRFTGFDKPILAPNGAKLTENMEHAFVGRAHFAGLKRINNPLSTGDATR